MTSFRTLSLKRESLTELTAGDLAHVVGGARPITDTCPTGDDTCSFLCRWTFNTCDC